MCKQPQHRPLMGKLSSEKGRIPHLMEEALAIIGGYIFPPDQCTAEVYIMGACGGEEGK